jgi:DNA-binding NarL/FixJ family response regulator
VSAGAAPPERTIRVVLADDDAAFLQSVRMLVEQQPALGVVGVAANGLEVLERVEELNPDAVVIDLHMPLLDGVTAVARLRQDHASLCLIALTGDPEPRLHRAVEEAGADAVMLKGQLLEGLSERIVSVRRGREATVRTT